MITTHVLDTSTGRPAAGVPVTLEQSAAGEWRLVGRGVTDRDGRLRTLTPEAAAPSAGIYRLVFETSRYFAALGVHGFYPVVVVCFEVAEGDAHYHVPLLLSPFGFATYRGS